MGPYELCTGCEGCGLGLSQLMFDAKRVPVSHASCANVMCPQLSLRGRAHACGASASGIGRESDCIFFLHSVGLDR